MENLLNPDIGLVIWTIIVFLILVAVLGRFAWRPLLEALRLREEGIRKAIQDAESGRTSVEQLKAQLEKELKDAHAKARTLFDEAQAEAGRIREKLVKDAELEAARMTDQTRKQLAEEKARLTRELRADVARLTILATEKLLQQTVDAKVQARLLDEFFKELDQTKKEKISLS